MTLIAQHIDNFTRHYSRAVTAWKDLNRVNERIERLCNAGEPFDPDLVKAKNLHDSILVRAMNERYLCNVAAKTLHELGLEVQLHTVLPDWHYDDLYSQQNEAA